MATPSNKHKLQQGTIKYQEVFFHHEVSHTLGQVAQKAYETSILYPQNSTGHSPENWQYQGWTT